MAECALENGRVPAECYLAIERAVESGNKPLSDKVDKVYNRMYVDNGKPCIQSVLESHRSQIRFQWWLISGVVVAIIAAAVRGIVAG